MIICYQRGGLRLRRGSDRVNMEQGKTNMEDGGDINEEELRGSVQGRWRVWVWTPSSIIIRGRLPDFKSTFLNKRCFLVRFGSCLSDLYDQEMGVPYCCLVYIDNKQYRQMFANWLERFVVCQWLLYLFPFEIIIAIQRQIQRCINSIQQWADKNEFQFSKFTLFSQLHSANANIVWCMYTIVREYKCMGLNVD